MKVLIRDGVTRDLQEIGESIAWDNPDAARAVDSKIVDVMLSLENERSLARPVLGNFGFDLHKISISKYPNYLIYFTERENCAEVLYVLHSARDLRQTIENDPRP